MEQLYIVQLEPGLWINGDPRHTDVMAHAETFKGMAAASRALTLARKVHPYPAACFDDVDDIEGWR